jgi:hypothetical protein
MRCWPWFAGCAVFVWALSLRWSAVEVVCVSAEREAGSFCVTTQCLRDLRRVTTTSSGNRILQDSFYCLDNEICR